MLPKGASQQLPDIGQLPRKRVKIVGSDSKCYRIDLGAGELVKEVHEKWQECTS